MSNQPTSFCAPSPSEYARTVARIARQDAARVTTDTRTPWTPGPWHIRHNGAHDGDRTVTGHHCDIAVFNGGPNDDHQTFANARLVAAAPDMADMLAWFCDYVAGKSDLMPPVESARTLLARIRGDA